MANAPPLPEIPGGWAIDNVTVLDRRFRLTLPRNPDAFLDDAKVQAAHRRNGYMPYWPYLWPAARQMARAVIERDWPPGARALEIGSGIGLVGLAGLSKGLRVTFSDYDPTAIAVAVHNARQNGFPEAQGALLDWRKPPQLSFPSVLACDVLYETCNHMPLLDTLQSVMTDDGQCWLGDPGRRHADSFLQRASESGFQINAVECAASIRSGTKQVDNDIDRKDFRLYLLGKSRSPERSCCRSRNRLG